MRLGIPRHGLTHEAVGDGEETDTPRDAVARPACLVYQSGKDKVRGASVREKDERDAEGEEEDDVADAAHQLNGGEEPDAPDVARKGQYAHGLHTRQLEVQGEAGMVTQESSVPCQRSNT